ncbi:MAG: hypothetical protein Q9196_007089 [Gyalolechia fulgens]
MAASSPLASSFDKLAALSMAVKAYSSGTTTLILPERPAASETNPKPFLIGAIGLLSDSTAYLYADRHYFDRRLDDVDKKVGTIDTKVDRHFGYMQRQTKDFKDNVKAEFQDVRAEIKNFKDDVKAEFKDVRAEIKDLKSEVKDLKSEFKDFRDEFKAFKDDAMSDRTFLRNRLATRMHHSIGKVQTLAPNTTGRPTNQAPPDFPSTVRRFWYLRSNIPALQRLAKHYAIDGWQDWKAEESEDAEVTQYENLEVAVARHPDLCLQSLAVTWGLEYGQLERPRAQEARPIARKRRADDETESRRVRRKEGSEYKADISLLSADGQDVIVRRRTTVSEPDVRVARHHLNAMLGLDPEREH